MTDVKVLLLNMLRDDWGLDFTPKSSQRISTFPRAPSPPR